MSDWDEGHRASPFASDLETTEVSSMRSSAYATHEARFLGLLMHLFSAIIVAVHLSISSSLGAFAGLVITPPVFLHRATPIPPP